MGAWARHLRLHHIDLLQAHWRFQGVAAAGRCGTDTTAAASRDPGHCAAVGIGVATAMGPAGAPADVHAEPVHTVRLEVWRATRQTCKGLQPWDGQIESKPA